VLWHVLFCYRATGKAKLANFAINTLLLFAAADLVFEPYFDAATDVTFTRIGALTHDSAKISVRYPSHFTSNDSIVQILWHKMPHNAIAPVPDAWTRGPVLNLTRDEDWMATTQIRGLWPETDYECTSYSSCNANSHRNSSCRRSCKRQSDPLGLSRKSYPVSNVPRPKDPWRVAFPLPRNILHDS
jgi:hypothetical protein